MHNSLEKVNKRFLLNFCWVGKQKYLNLDALVALLNFCLQGFLFFTLLLQSFLKLGLLIFHATNILFQFCYMFLTLGGQ